MKDPARIPLRHGGGRFHCPGLTETGEPGLDPGEAHHLLHVMRAHPGTLVDLFDGRGAVAQAELASVAPLRLRIVRRWFVPRPVPAFTVAVPPPAPGRFDFLAEKITELGAAVCIPLRAERHPPDHERRLRRAADRWRRITVEAAKQCGNPWLPELSAPAAPAGLAARDGGGILLVAALHGEARPLREILPRLASAPWITGVVGPEGGFTESETAAFRDARALFADLGPRVLRVETAAILLAAAVSVLGTPHPAAGARHAPRSPAPVDPGNASPST